MRVIRASEISAFLYCQRAWWYRKSGYASENIAELEQGTALHNRHGSRVQMTAYLRYAAIISILLALILVAVYIANQIL